MKDFLDIIMEIMSNSSLEYDIFLLSDLITGFCLNSDYRFPVYEYSEKICKKYNNHYHSGYFSTLRYYEKNEAIKVFFNTAKFEQIGFKNEKETEDNLELEDFLLEIGKRPGQYLHKIDVINLAAFIEGYLAGQDIKEDKKIGASLRTFEEEIDTYFSDKYELHENRYWWEKIEFVSHGIKDVVYRIINYLND